MIKNTNEFLAIIDQQRAFMKRNNLPVKQLETLIIGNQIALCNKQKEVTDYFKSFSQSPKPNDVYKTVADVSMRHYNCRFVIGQYIGHGFNGSGI